MNKKLFLFLISLVFLFGARLVRAEVLINEVQIGATATNDEFIELYNSGSSSVDLTGWSIKKKTSSGTEYSLVSASRLEGKTIQSNSYFLLTNENGYVGSVTSDATWASSNTMASNNTIILYNGSQIEVDKVGWGEASDCSGTCAPNPTDGQSLQKSNNTWILGPATPKAENQTGSANNTNTSENTNQNTNTDSNTNTNNPQEEKSVSTTSTNSTSSSSSGLKTVPKKVEIPTIKLKILTTPLAFVGQPILFGSSLLGYSNEKLVLGKLFWNFGDGSSYEQINNFEKFNHLYGYPGEYAVTLEYYKNSYDQEPETVSKLNLKVVPLTVSISRVGDSKDFFIELSNNSNYDMDISGWVVRYDGKMFVLPRNTTILAQNKLILSGMTTGFSFTGSPDLKLYSVLGELVFDYYPSLAPSKSTRPYFRESTEPNEKNSNEIEESDSLVNNSSTGLEGSAILADTEASGKPDSSYYFFFGFVGLLIISSVGIYYIRRNKSAKNQGDDFSIIDE